MRRALLLGGLLALLPSVLLPRGESWSSRLEAAPPPAKIALTGGRIIPVRGPDLETGTILIEDGRITAIGETVELPYDAMEIDCSGKVLFPGMIDPFNWRGLDIPNEAVGVVPYLDVYDAIDPSRVFFEETLRSGITSVHISHANNVVIGGVSRLLRPIGRTPDEMTRKAPLSIQIATSPRSGSDRMQQLAQIREAFLELDDYLGRLAEKRYEEDRKEKGESVDVPPDEAREKGRSLVRDVDIDREHRNLARLRRGEIAAWFYCSAATDVAPAIEVAQDQGLIDDAVFLIGADAYRAVAELMGTGRPVVCPDDLVARSRDPFTGEVSEVFVPRVLHEAGIPFALRPNPDGSLAERYLTYQAARCVRAGIPREVALAAITLTPARLLGMADEVGSIEVGKRGDIVILSGDPLDFASWVEEVYIDGVLAYDRDRDPRLAELIGLEDDPPAEGDESGGNDAEAGSEPGESPEPSTDRPAPEGDGGADEGGRD